MYFPISEMNEGEGLIHCYKAERRRKLGQGMMQNL